MQYTCVENELEVIKLKFRVFEKEKNNAVWEPVAKDVIEDCKEPLHMTVRMAGGAGSLVAGKPGKKPEGFTWQVRKIPQRQPDRRKRVEKWTGLRLRKSKKKEKEEEIYGESDDKNKDEDKDKDKKKKPCPKPADCKKSRPVLTLRGMFGMRKSGDYDQMSLLKDPTSFKYMADLEKAGLAKALKKKQKEKGQEEVRGREMVGPDGQIWPYGGMGAPWYMGPLCHPECTCLLPGFQDPDTTSKEYKLVKKLFDIANASLDPTGSDQHATGTAKPCKDDDDDDDVCENSKEKQQEVLHEIGEEIMKMMLASQRQHSKKRRRHRKKSISPPSPSSEEGNVTYDDSGPEGCIGEVCRLRAEKDKNESETAKKSVRRSRRSSRKSYT